MRAALACLLSLWVALPLYAGNTPALQPPPSAAEREVEAIAEALSGTIGDVEALTLVFRLRELVNKVSDLARLREVLLGPALSRHMHGEVKALARLTLAEIEWRRGRRPKAQRWIRGLDLLTQALFVGPFDNTGGGGFDTVFPPEEEVLRGEEPDLSVEYEGKAHPVHWRRLPPVAPLGYVDLDSVVTPSDEVVVYVRAVIHSSESQSASLRLGTPGPSRAWLNGRQVFETSANHPPRFDQHAVPIRLLEGDNVLLLKLCQREGALGFYLRVADPDGAPLRGIRLLETGGAGPSPGARVVHERRRALPRVHTLLERARHAAERAPKSAAAALRLARLLGARYPFDRTEEQHLEAARRAAKLAAPDDPLRADALYLVARFETDPNRRRLALEEAIQVNPRHLRALEALGAHHLARGRPREALGYFERALEVDPNAVDAALGRADALGILSFPEDERRVVERLYETRPSDPRVLRRAAWLERSRSRLDQAEAILRVGTGLFPGDRRLRDGLVAVLLQRGKLEDALSELKLQAEFFPDSVWTRLRIADLASTNGRPEVAEAEYAAAIRLAPDLGESYLRRARHWLRRGDTLHAREDLATAGRLMPQNPEVTRLKDLLEEDKEDFSMPYRAGLEELVAAAGPAPEGVDARTLFDGTFVKVHKNGLASRVVQQVHQVLTERGAERLRALSQAYTPGDQELRVLEARVRKPDGQVLQARSESERSLSEPWYRLYYDRRARLIRFPDLEPGDVVEVVWRVDDVAAENIFGDYFGDLTYLQGTAPIDHARYVLIGPKGRRFFFNEVKLPRISHRVEQRPDGTQVLLWDAYEVPRIVTEPGMPGWSEVAAYLHVSTYESWAEVAEWWWSLVRDQVVPPQALEDLAHRLVADLPDADLKHRVAAIHNYVVRATRYVGLEFGIHGFKPYRVDQIYERRFGDCKDKASLMYALLRAVGIESKLVLLRMRRLGRISKFPASLAVFNHAILYVPALDLWLDGTAEFSGTTELPPQDRGASVLVVDPKAPGQSVFTTVPEPPASANVSETRLSVAVTPDGTATAEGHFEVRGAAAPDYRRAFQTKEDRSKRFEQSLSRLFPGVRVRSLEMEGIDDLETPVRADFSLELPRFAVRQGQALQIDPFGEGRGYAERYAPLSKRRFDLLLDYPFTSRTQMQITVPAGYEALDLPKDTELETPHGRLSLSWRRDGDRVVVESTVVLSQSRIPPGEYASFRTFLGRIDQALDQKLVLRPSAARRRR